MRPADAVRQPLMILQAFIDESSKAGIFVLGGAIASAESWAAFSKEWEEMLPLVPLGPDLKRNFKFSEMMGAGPERIENIGVFARVLEQHAICTLSSICSSMTYNGQNSAFQFQEYHSPGVISTIPICLPSVNSWAFSTIKRTIFCGC
jgi:hypothetical protein